MEQKALSQITPTEARTLLKFMQTHIPEPKRLNPAMTWEESHQVDRLFDKIRAVLSCRADKESGIENLDEIQNGGTSNAN